MPARFLLDTPPEDGHVVIGGELASHLARSLRVRVNDTLVAVDPGGTEHGVRLAAVGATAVEGDVVWSRPVTGEPMLRVTLLQALPRDRMEDCVDVAVQAGVAAIVPVLTERTVRRPEPGRTAARLRRWNAVAREAAQLAGRGTIPRVHAPEPLATALDHLAPGTRVVACTIEREAPPLTQLDIESQAPLALCVGPEGGLGAADLKALDEHGAEWAHLGPRVLRTRYAGAVATALLLGRAGDLDRAAAPLPW
ncbi:MAG: RsmE family RNA methyltransferase [Candidatus Dormibacter sp.]